MDKDLYEILRVSRNATQEEIKKSYHKLCREYHPDVCKDPDAEDKIKEINAAYEVLGDENKRAAYDRFGTTDGTFNTGGFGFGSMGGYSPFEDIINQMFGGAAQSSSYRTGQPTRGEDLFKTITIDFLDAVHGTTVPIDFDVEETCPHCHGTRAEHPEDVHTCQTCKGNGYVTRVYNSLLGQMREQVVCPDCQGTGKTVSEKCHTCKGTGYRSVHKTVEAKIPRGIQSGRRIRLYGIGEPGRNGGQNGDVIVTVNVKEHPVFTREGNDILINVPISAVDATLGTTLTVPTVDGEETIVIRPGTQPGQAYSLKGKGVKTDFGTGSEIVTINVEIPKKVSERERELYEELRNNASSKPDSPFDRFKNFFSGKN